MEKQMQPIADLLKERDQLKEENERLKKMVYDLGWEGLIKERDSLKQLNSELVEALEKSQQDINWMLNNRQFLNQEVFNYIEQVIHKSKAQTI